MTSLMGSQAGVHRLCVLMRHIVFLCGIAALFSGCLDGVQPGQSRLVSGPGAKVESPSADESRDPHVGVCDTNGSHAPLAESQADVTGWFFQDGQEVVAWRLTRAHPEDASIPASDSASHDQEDATQNVPYLIVVQLPGDQKVVAQLRLQPVDEQASAAGLWEGQAYGSMCEYTVPHSERGVVSRQKRSCAVYVRMHDDARSMHISVLQTHDTDDAHMAQKLSDLRHGYTHIWWDDLLLHFVVTARCEAPVELTYFDVRRLGEAYPGRPVYQYVPDPSGQRTYDSDGRLTRTAMGMPDMSRYAPGTAVPVRAGGVASVVKLEYSEPTMPLPPVQDAW